MRTCIVTAFYCFVGNSPRDSKRTGVVHIVFNCIGTVLFLIAMTALRSAGFFGGLWESVVNSGVIANFQTLQFIADRGGAGYLIGNDFMLTVVQNGRISFPAGCSGTISVFCLGPDASGVTLKGLYYPLEEGTLCAGFPLGVSNHFTGEPAEISVRQGSLLVLWNRENGFPVRER